MNGILDRFDHPVVFVIFLTMSVLGTKAIMEWAFKTAGLSGPAALAE